MSYLAAGVVLLIVGILVYLFTTAATLGAVIGIAGGGLILYAVLSRRHV